MVGTEDQIFYQFIDFGGEPAGMVESVSSGPNRKLRNSALGYETSLIQNRRFESVIFEFDYSFTVYLTFHISFVVIDSNSGSILQVCRLLTQSCLESSS